MKKIKIVNALAIAILLQGCKTQTSNHISERGWIGGEYTTVNKPRHSKTSPTTDNFSKNTEPDQKGAALITAIYPGTPSAMAGLQTGDLVTRINNQTITSRHTLLKAIRKLSPGVSSEIEILRDGKPHTRKVEIGEELFDPEGTLLLGLQLSTRLDLIPNRRFSLFFLGWNIDHSQLELASPISQHAINQGTDSPMGSQLSREGWNMWIGPFKFARNKRILSQTATSGTQLIQQN